MTRAINPELVTRATQSVENLLELLFDGLDWPKPAHLEVDDIPLIDLRPADLHLREDAIARLSSVKQLPPLTAQQPFGVFILTFEGDRLPIGAIRRVVDGVVRRKRTRGRTGTAVWDLDDLMFFCRTGDGGGSVHVVAFREQDGKRALRAISWSTDLPAQKLALLTQETLPSLVWPEDGGLDLGAWRAGWRDAFQTSYRQGVRSAEALAQVMADTAREVRDGISELIELETDDGPLRRIFSQVRANLREDLDEAAFADMYAQTMVYGLLTARITHPEEFLESSTALVFENNFLDALYTTFSREHDDAVNIDEFGLLELSGLLVRTDVDVILAEFGAKDPRNDPVMYFYEEFLEKYDSARRKELGAYYTPVPVVSWIVDAIDELLRSHCNLPGGIIDRSTWSEYSARTGIAVPSGLDAGERVVRALDPATGTGTFLLEWLRKSANGTSGALRSVALRDALETIDAFEIDLPGYTVAHLKTSLELPPSLRAHVTPGIVLTDTLAGQRELRLRSDDAIAAEGERAERLKFKVHHNVVLGNPPYRRLAQSAGGGIVTEVRAGRRLIDDFYEIALANAGPRYLQQFYNLYIYFWRWASWKAFEQVPDGPAVIGFITPRSWLTGRGFMGVREHIRRYADALYILDLGGELRGAEKDANIFGIQSPVAISIAVRAGITDFEVPAKVRYAKVFGTREKKLQALTQKGLGAMEWEDILADWRDVLVPASGGEDWFDYPALADLFPWQQSGAVYSRTWPIAPHPTILQARWNRLMSSDDAADRAKCFKTAKHGRKITTRVRDLPRLIDEPVGAPPRPIVRYAYRSFDRQWTFEDPRLAFAESPTLWAVKSEKQIYLVTAMTRPMSRGPAAICTTAVPDYDYFCGRGGKDVIPLYRGASLTPNIDPGVLAAIRDALGSGSDDGPFAEDVFSYAYGVLSGTDYTDRFSVELETAGPRLPLSADATLFSSMVQHGRRLIWIDTYAERHSHEFGSELFANLGTHWNPAPIIGPKTDRDVSFDSVLGRLVVGDGVLEGVTPGVVAFDVNGLNVLGKWLGYRTLKGSGRAASGVNPLDAIRHEAWVEDWSEELRRLIHVLAAHHEMQREGSVLLDNILDGPLIPAAELPEVDERWRAAPVGQESLGGLFDLAAES